MLKKSLKITVLSFFEKHLPTLRRFAPPKKKTLEESTLVSQEVKQNHKELPLTRPCWMDRFEVGTNCLKPLLISECSDFGWMSFVE
jgi:hypothetical protein